MTPSSTLNSKTATLYLYKWLLVLLVIPQLALFIFFSNNSRDTRVDEFYERAEALDAITLGSSHTRAIHYPSMGLNGYSFADDGGDIEIAELKFRAIKDYSRNLDYVFIPVSPGLLSYNRILGVPKSFPNDYLRYSPLPKSFSDFSFLEILYLFKARALQLQADLFLANKHIKDAIRMAIKGNKNSNAAQQNIVCEFLLNDPEHPHEDGIHRGFAKHPVAPSCFTDEWQAAAAERRIVRMQRSLEKEPDLLKLNIQRLASIADTADNLGAKLVLVISPTTQAYFEHSGLQILWQEEKPAIEQFAQRDNVEIIDFHTMFFDYPITQENHWFSDPDHLSLNGAQLFSKRVAEELQRIE